MMTSYGGQCESEPACVAFRGCGHEYLARSAQGLRAHLFLFRVSMRVLQSN